MRYSINHIDMNNESYIATLKHLISICNDGKKGYSKAAESSQSANLISKFTCYATEREGFVEQLKAEIIKLGGSYDSDNDGGPLGAIHRMWLDIKTALTADDDKIILETCKNGDKAALEAYDDALQGTLLNSIELKSLLITQRAEISETLDEIERLYFKEFKH